MARVLIERRNLGANICMGRIPHTQKGRYCGCAFTSQGMPKITGKPAEARAEARADSSSHTQNICTYKTYICYIYETYIYNIYIL